MMTIPDPSNPPIEITVSAYFITEDPAKATEIAETLQRIAAGFALGGGVDTAVRIGTVPQEEVYEVTPEYDDPER